MVKNIDTNKKDVSDDIKKFKPRPDGKLPNDTVGRIKDILVPLIQMNYTHMEHYHNQRSTFSNLLVIVATAIFAVVGFDKAIDKSDILPIAFLILVGILEQRLDDFNRPLWVPQCEGSKTANEIPGVLDEVIIMVAMKTEDAPDKRAFVCQTLNPWGYPAKDRSGRLDMVEEPHLGRLMEKIRRPLGDPPPARLEFGRPAAAVAIPDPTPNPTDAIKGA